MIMSMLETFKLEQCADVIVSAAAHRSILVGGGALLVPKIGVGSQKIFPEIHEKISFYPQNFLLTFFSHRKLQENKYTATMASATRQQIIGGSGAPINKSRWRCPQIGGGAAGTRL